MSYKVELTEKQMKVTMVALEEYFRLRMGQTFDFANDLSCMGMDLSPDNQKHDELFEEHIRSRDWIENIMGGIFRTLWSPCGIPSQKTDDMMIAECIWDAIRFALGRSRWSEPFQIGDEPSPKIEKVKE